MAAIGQTQGAITQPRDMTSYIQIDAYAQLEDVDRVSNRCSRDRLVERETTFVERTARDCGFEAGQSQST